MGADFLYSAVVIERRWSPGPDRYRFLPHSDIVAPYILHYGSGGAETEVPAQAGFRRDGHGHRHDRAGCRLRPEVQKPRPCWMVMST